MVPVRVRLPVTTGVSPEVTRTVTPARSRFAPSHRTRHGGTRGGTRALAVVTAGRNVPVAPEIGGPFPASSCVRDPYPTPCPRRPTSAYVAAGDISPLDATLITATHLRGLPLADTARLLGLSYEAAKKRRQRAQCALACHYRPHPDQERR